MNPAMPKVSECEERPGNSSADPVSTIVSWLSPGRGATVAFVVALMVSLIMVQVVRPLLKIDRPLGGEAYDGYLELAQNLVAGNGYVFEPGGHKVFHRPPLFPALLVPGMFLPEAAHRIYGCLYGLELYNGGDPVPIVPPGVSIASAVQKIFSAVMIFLFGLALRNMLKMK